MCFENAQPNHLKVGDNLVVYDAGGGTVDVIAYRILGLEPLSLVESQVGTGDLCGATFLNLRFDNLAESEFGLQNFRALRVKKPRT